MFNKLVEWLRGKNKLATVVEEKPKVSSNRVEVVRRYQRKYYQRPEVKEARARYFREYRKRMREVKQDGN
jgi:hypothetical protein